MTLESLPQTRDNHFNLLRMVAAAMVLVFHAFTLSRGDAGHAMVSTSIGVDLGSAALTTFFAISGYFVFMSFERHRSRRAFLAARALRILPALLVCSLFSAFVIGPIFTELSPTAYFADPSVWLYPLRTVSIVQIMGAGLPEMFVNNPWPRAVNDSLWTIYFEVACYVGLFLGGVAGLVKRRRFHWLLLAYVPMYFLARYGPWENLLYFATFSLPFVTGMAIYRYRDSGILMGWLPASFIALAAVAALMGQPVEELWTLAIAFGVIWIGFAPARWLLPYNGLGDFSYGTYLYGLVIEQVIAALLPGIGPLGMILIALPSAVLCGACSWHFIECPALNLRPAALLRLGTGRRATAAS